MKKRMRRRAYKVLVAAVVVVGVLATVAWILNHRTDPTHVTQAQLHAWGTSSKSKRFEAVKQHKVEFTMSEVDPRELAELYFARVLARNPDPSAQGRFSPQTGIISIMGKECCFDASLPGGYHPVFYHILRHEYGHAAFNDWLRARGITPVAAENLGSASRTSPPDRVPKALVELVAEWRTQSDRVYGPEYLSANLGEYVAESYARYLMGKSVPPRAALFLKTQYAGRRL